MATYGVRMTARREPELSRWLWIVKTILLIPHYIILAFLWLAVLVLTFIGYFVVLFAGKFPKSFHTFNVGVLRWGWRVGYYGHGVFGTDKYPPFALRDIPEYPARLEIDYPESIPRWRFFSWILAIPHLLIVGAFTGPAVLTSTYYTRDGGVQVTGIGLMTVLALSAVIWLLVTKKYPKGLYDFLLGINRWILRTCSYVGLLSAGYPPFRLDMGDDDPSGDYDLHGDPVPHGDIEPAKLAEPPKPSATS